MYWISIRSEDGFDRYKFIKSCWIFNLLDFFSGLLSNCLVIYRTLKLMEKPYTKINKLGKVLIVPGHI